MIRKVNIVSLPLRVFRRRDKQYFSFTVPWFDTFVSTMRHFDKSIDRINKTRKYRV